MDRIFLVAFDGRVFFAEPNSTWFEPLDDVRENEDEPVRIKKLSPSRYCLWAISSQFQVNVYVFESDIPIEFQEVTYENQRRYNLLSSNSFTDKLLPSDRFKFSSADGHAELNKDSFVLPSASWVWESDWFHDQTVSEGWEYAVDFPNHYRPKFFMTACVRRRKWMRNRLFTNYKKFIQVKGPDSSDCIIDIATGGWDIQFCENGFMAVWIVTNDGLLFFREDVSLRNIEGSRWVPVALPPGIRLLSCSCSMGHGFWGVSYNGALLVREGISREKPMGTTWHQLVENNMELNFRQISLGKNSVWALDCHGDVYYRCAFTPEKPYGKSWAQIPSNMSCLSVSCVDQVSWPTRGLSLVSSDIFNLVFYQGVGHRCRREFALL